MNLRFATLAALLVMTSALISQALSFSDLAFSLFWPPAGIAFALVWQFGPRALPSVAVGIGIPTLILYPGWGSGLVILGETCGPWAGVALLRRLRCGPNIARPLRWQLLFYACGLLLACPIAALLGSLGGVVAGRFPASDIPRVFGAYMMVEAIGLVLFGPLLIQWYRRDPPPRVPAAQPERSQWAFAAPVVIESARTLLFYKGAGNYADLLIYCYFPLVVWCALTGTAQRTNALLVWTAVAVLTSQAWRLHGQGASTATFDVFRIALVTLILSATGQLVAALVGELRAAFAEVARQADLDPLTGLSNERSFTRALDRLPRPFKLVLLAFDNWPEFEILAGIGAGYDLQREVTALLRQLPGLIEVARLQPGIFACLMRADAAWPAPFAPLLERRWSEGRVRSEGKVEMRLIGVALQIAADAPEAAGELMLGARAVLNEALFAGDGTTVLRQWSPAIVAERRAYERLVDRIRHQVRAVT